MTQIETLSATTGSAQLSAFIALRVFEKIVSDVYSQGKTPGLVVYFHEEEKGTVRYIGGAVVRKIKSRLRRIDKIEQKDEKLQCLDAMCQNRVESTTDMTSVLDKGGLTYLKSNVAEVFYKMETLFRSLTGSNIEKISSADFVLAAMEDESITSGFYESLYPCTFQTSVVEAVLQYILELYFKIRIHHKLKTTMDTIRAKTRKTKREKGLRKKIQAASIEQVIS